MSQNIYDDPQLFADYAALDHSVRRLDGTPEWSSLQAILPSITGLRVVDLGCGYGWFCHWAQQRGTSQITSSGVSQHTLAQTREMTRGDEVVYRCAGLQTLMLPAGNCDLVYGSLALYYSPDIAPLFVTLQQVLVPGGALVFSAEHPIYTVPLQQGWRVGDQGQRNWPVSHYQQEGEHISNWSTEGVIKQHRKLSSWINALIAMGFVLERLDEWGPSTEQIVQQPALDEEKERPMIFLLRAHKPG